MLLLHSQERGQALVEAPGRAAQLRITHGVPANVIPVALWHTASLGLELWLSAIAWGATQLVVLVTEEEAPPSPELLAQLRVAATEAPAAGGFLEEPWRELVGSARAEGDAAVANLTQQQAFFGTHLQPWVLPLCDAIAAHPRARFYAALAGFTRAFASVETQGFDMLV